MDSEQKKDAWRAYAIKLVIAKAEPLKVSLELARRDQLKAKIENLKAEFARGAK